MTDDQPDASMAFAVATAAVAIRRLEEECDDREGMARRVLLSFWNSRDDIVAFAGVDIDRAVFYPEDDRFLVARELTVRHYELAAEHAPGPWRD